MTRWLVTGAAGMLGRDLLAALGDDDVTGLTRDDLDVTDTAAVRDVVRNVDVVVNAAAWTDVDGAEPAEASAFAVNALGPANLATACADVGARMLHVSTDYVFAGDASAPYDEAAPLAPRSAYGRSKAAGEWAVRAHLPDHSWVVRTAWLYATHGSNFVRTMLRLESERDTLDVVADQRGQPTWSRDLAVRIVEMVRGDVAPGTYHGTASGEATWCDLARAVFELAGADPARVRPTTTDRFPRPAPRPAYSVLGHDGWAPTGLAPLRPWRAALGEALADASGDPA